MNVTISPIPNQRTIVMFYGPAFADPDSAEVLTPSGHINVTVGISSVAPSPAPSSKSLSPSTAISYLDLHA
jgi:hypothetical protein